MWHNRMTIGEETKDGWYAKFIGKQQSQTVTPKVPTPVEPQQSTATPDMFLVKGRSLNDFESSDYEEVSSDDARITARPTLDIGF